MSGESSNTGAPLPLSNVLHMIPIKLSSTNYLLWQKQMLPLLAYQQITGYVDGSTPKPLTTITTGDVSSQNHAYVSLIIHDSLERSLEHTHTLRDSLQHLKKETSTISEFSRGFKTICDQLQAIGHPLPDDDKTYWFLCGLGSSLRPSPPLNTISDSSVAPVAFNITHRSSTNSLRGRGSISGRSPYRSSSNQGRVRGTRHPPHCQLCRTKGHYASEYPDLPIFSRSSSTIDAHLAEAF
ncbi:putative RNA-directed DNA polymerase [Tanacetum coccineum]